MVFLVYVFFVLFEILGCFFESMDKFFERLWYSVCKIVYFIFDDFKLVVWVFIEDDKKDYELVIFELNYVEGNIIGGKE